VGVPKGKEASEDKYFEACKPTGPKRGTLPVALFPLVAFHTTVTIQEKPGFVQWEGKEVP